MAQSKLDSFFTRPAPKRKKVQEADLSAVCAETQSEILSNSDSFAESESSFRSDDISCEIEELEETEEFR